MPTDPRSAAGTCAALGVAGSPFNGVYQAYQTGGAGAGTIVASSIASYGAYPPTINGLPAGATQTLLPTYTSTSAVPTLPPPTFTPSPSPSVSAGNGWFDSGDTGLAPTQVQGCAYPNAWDAVSSAMPTALCPAVGGATPTVATTSVVITSVGGVTSTVGGATTTVATSSATSTSALAPTTTSLVAKR